MTWRPTIDPPADILEGGQVKVENLADWFSRCGVDPREAELCLLTRDRELLPCFGGPLDGQWALIESDKSLFRLDTGSLAPKVSTYQRRTVTIPASPSPREESSNAFKVFVMVGEDGTTQPDQRSLTPFEVRKALSAGPFGRIAKIEFRGSNAFVTRELEE